MALAIDPEELKGAAGELRNGVEAATPPAGLTAPNARGAPSVGVRAATLIQAWTEDWDNGLEAVEKFAANLESTVTGLQALEENITQKVQDLLKGLVGG
jgi:hypothetical protein